MPEVEIEPEKLKMFVVEATTKPKSTGPSVDATHITHFIYDRIFLRAAL